MPSPISKRFWSKTKPSKVHSWRGSACWEWQGATNEKGYGKFKLNGAVMRTNRVAWILANGMIGGALHVLHHCDNPTCCNPKHLFLGTNQDNVNDREQKGRGAKLNKRTERKG